MIDWSLLVTHGLHGRLRPPKTPVLKGGAALIRFLIAPDFSGVDWRLD
jgi:hypothetical protein